MYDEDKNNEGGSPDVRHHRICKICGERASGRYFGAEVCDACKGFFRRSVRSSQDYFCRFNRNCVIDKDKRNQCRYCRLKKCFKAGMRKESVQKERDTVKGRGKGVNSKVDMNKWLTLEMLKRADEYVKPKTACPPAVHGGDETGRAVANMGDFYDSTKEQLLSLVEWTKCIPPFLDLPLEDRVALVRGHASNTLLVGLVRRSMHLKDTILLGNGFVIPRNSNGVTGLSERIIDDLIFPCRRANMDETEFGILRAVVFFDPTSPGLTNRERIYELRDQARLILEDYIMVRGINPRGRLSAILLTLPSFRSTCIQLREEVQFRKLFDIVQVDKLLEEIVNGFVETNDEDGDEVEPTEGYEVPEEYGDGSNSKSSFSEDQDLSCDSTSNTNSPSMYQETDDFSKEYHKIVNGLHQWPKIE